MTIRSFSDITESLEISASEGAFVQKRDSRVTVVDAFAAIAPGSGLEALLLGIPVSLVGNVDEWPISEGFRIDIQPLSGGDPTKVLVCLQLSQPVYRNVFLALAEDLCGVLAVAADSSEATRDFRRRLASWQEFLKKHRPDGLSEDEQVGLFCELHFFNELLAAEMGAIAAVSGWRGYLAANQDFQFPGVAVEIKCTRAASPTSVHITNVRQLDDEAVGALYLGVISIDRNMSAGQSLPDLVAALRAKLDGEALGIFNEGLRQVGYLDVHKSLYERHLHQVLDQWYHEVRDTFPRITRKEIPEGVSAVTYKLILAKCAPYRIDRKMVVARVLKSKVNDIT